MTILTISIVVVAVLAAILWPRKCPKCGSRHTSRVKSGFVSIQDNLCHNCGECFDSLPMR